MSRPPEDEPFVTAEDALIDIEMTGLGMREGGTIGRLEGDEARKLAEALFTDEEGGMPDEIRRFFAGPDQEES